MNDDCNQNEKLFFKGKYFSNQYEFWKYFEDWPFMKMDEETFFREWNDLGKNIWMNVILRDIEMSNGTLYEIIQDNFIHILEKLLEKQEYYS